MSILNKVIKLIRRKSVLTLIRRRNVQTESDRFRSYSEEFRSYVGTMPNNEDHSKASNICFPCIVHASLLDHVWLTIHDVYKSVPTFESFCKWSCPRELISCFLIVCQKLNKKNRSKIFQTKKCNMQLYGIYKI